MMKRKHRCSQLFQQSCSEVSNDYLSKNLISQDKMQNTRKLKQYIFTNRESLYFNQEDLPDSLFTKISNRCDYISTADDAIWQMRFYIIFFRDEMFLVK